MCHSEWCDEISFHPAPSCPELEPSFVQPLHAPTHPSSSQSSDRLWWHHRAVFMSPFFHLVVAPGARVGMLATHTCHREVLKCFLPGKRCMYGEKHSMCRFDSLISGIPRGISEKGDTSVSVYLVACVASNGFLRN